MTQKLRIALAAMFAASAAFADRPELLAFPFRESVTAAAELTASTVGTNFVLTGTIDGNVSVTASEACRVTLKNLTMTGVLTISGDAQVWLDGANTISTTAASAIASSDGTLTVGGPGSLAAQSYPTKKTGVISAEDFVLAGGTTTLTVLSSDKNACGVCVGKKKKAYTQLAGTLKIVIATGASDKANGILLSKSNMTAVISGGLLDISNDTEKGIGIALDDDTNAMTLSGGIVKLAMSGDAGKGIKDGTFNMTGGAIDATISGGYVEELYQDDYDRYYYVTINSSTTTSGNSAAGSNSLTVKATTMINTGIYPVYDPSKAYAVKVTELNISGGLVRVRCTGTCGRGLGADNMYLSGGVYDISVAGGPTDVYVEPLEITDNSTTDADTGAVTTNVTVTTCLDSGGAACLKTSGTNSVMSITGGTFELKATGTAGKLINAAGYLVIGTEDATTLPTDSSFSPDIQGQVLGAKTYCTYYKQKYYGSIATATAATALSGITNAVASANIVTASGNSDDCDYSNAKAAKGQSGVTFNSGRYRVYTANDGGEGLESKDWMTINGGILEFNCADDCINTAGDLTINGGYIYAASTGNDAIDSNANVTINDGWIYAFTLSTPEEAIDVNSGYSIKINGGYIFGIGAEQSGREGSISGNYYQGSQTLGTSATYWKASGTDTIYGKIPAAASSSTSGYLFVSVPGMTSGTAPTSYGTSAPSGSSVNSVGFHGFYTTGEVSNGSSSSGGDSGSLSGGDSGSDSGDTLASGNWTTDGTLTYSYDNASFSYTYSAAYIASANASYVLSNATISATSSNKLGLLAANGAQVTLVNCTIVKSGDGSGQSNDDNYNFYGVNNAITVLGSGTSVTLDNCTVTTSAKYANAVFASDSGTITVTNGINIVTTGESSRGLFASYSGTVQAPDGGIRISTASMHCAGLVTDRGGGTVICGSSANANASYVNTTANDSPCIYSTGTVSGYNIVGVCTNGQAVVIEGNNVVSLNSCDMTGGRSGQGCIFLYQSGSGDASDSDAAGNYSTLYATNCTFTARNSADMYVVSHTVAHVNAAGCTYRNTNGTDYTASTSLGSSGEMFVKCYEIQWDTGNYLTLVTSDSLVGTVYTGDTSSRATITHGGNGLIVSSSNVGTVTINGTSY